MSVDLRTRLDTEQAPIHAGQFFRELLPDLFDAAQAEIAPGARALPLRPFWRGATIVFPFRPARRVGVVCA